MPILHNAPGRTKVGCETLDGLLGGGIENGCITQFYGEAGTGKTNICLQLARNVALTGKKVVYVDTEAVSMERLHQICGAEFEKVLKELLVSSPYSLEEQEAAVRNGTTLKEVGLFVVDTINMYVRMQTFDEKDSASRLARGMLEALTSAARRFEYPVVVTSQVFYSSESDEVLPFRCGNLEHIAKAIVRLERVSAGRRKAVVVKHRSIPEGESCEFSITQGGLE